MTPHLTISYASQTPPGPAPAGAKPAAASEAANPLGFLAALLDQLLAGATPPEPAPPATEPQEQVSQIAAPAIAAPVAPVSAPAPAADADPVARILRVLLDKDEATAEAGAPVMQMLAALGVTLPTAPADTTPETLGTQLTQMSTALAAAAPALATRLDAVAAALVAPDADPAFLDKLRSAAADPDPAPLDALLRTLVAPKPTAAPAAPQIAGTTQLDLPAALAPAASEPAPVARKATPAPADAPRDTTAKLTLAAPPADAPADPETSRPDPLPARGDPALPPQPNAAPVTTPRPLPAAYQAPANPINMGQLAFEMVRQVHQGASRFTIRLDPPELGRVDVRLHVDASGSATARLTVDRAETLDLFQRDQRTLERALAQAGFDTTRTSLEFSLRQDGSAGFAGGQEQPDSTGPARFSLDGEAEPPPPVLTLYRGTASAGGVNIFV